MPNALIEAAKNVEFSPRSDELHEDLTDLQNAYLYWAELGFTPTQSARRAGYTDVKNAAYDNSRHPKIKKYLTQSHSNSRVKHDIDRDRVVEGIMEALSVAREQSDSKVMLQTWVEIARITGVQAPEVKKLEVQGEVTQHHIAHASDKELLEILGKQRELEAPIEGDYEDITDVEDSE